MELSSQNVHDIFMDCLFKNDELCNGRPAENVEFVQVAGIIHGFGFHKERLVSHTDEIKSMLMQLKSSFRESVGGGMSFLRMCITQDGVQWGEHSNCEELVCLGVGINKCSIILREVQSVLPGGLPYVLINDV